MTTGRINQVAALRDARAAGVPTEGSGRRSGPSFAGSDGRKRRGHEPDRQHPPHPKARTGAASRGDRRSTEPRTHSHRFEARLTAPRDGGSERREKHLPKSSLEPGSDTQATEPAPRHAWATPSGREWNGACSGGWLQRIAGSPPRHAHRAPLTCRHNHARRCARAPTVAHRLRNGGFLQTAAVSSHSTEQARWARMNLGNSIT